MTDETADSDADADANADDWRVLDSKTEYETGWYDGGYDLVEQPDSSQKRYYWADLPPAVVVVAIDGDDVVFVDQYRPVIQEQCLELPAGIVEQTDGYQEATESATRPSPEFEPWVDAAARELQEETGYIADDLTLLETLDVATGVLQHERGIVVAEGLTEAKRDLDANEFLEVKRIPTADAISIAREDPTNDSTLEGLLLAAADGYL